MLDSSKLKELADDNFKRDINGRKFSVRVENNVGKGEIARYEQSFLFPQCFQKPNFVKRGHIGSVKAINSRKPVQIIRAELGQNLLAMVNFLIVKGTAVVA